MANEVTQVIPEHDKNCIECVLFISNISTTVSTST
jgi:hypothetical protein